MLPYRPPVINGLSRGTRSGPISGQLEIIQSKPSRNLLHDLTHQGDVTNFKPT